MKLPERLAQMGNILLNVLMDLTSPGDNANVTLEFSVVLASGSSGNHTTCFPRGEISLWSVPQGISGRRLWGGTTVSS